MYPLAPIILLPLIVTNLPCTTNQPRAIQRNMTLRNDKLVAHKDNEKILLDKCGVCPCPCPPPRRRRTSANCSPAPHSFGGEDRLAHWSGLDASAEISPGANLCLCEREQNRCNALRGPTDRQADRQAGQPTDPLLSCRLGVGRSPLYSHCTGSIDTLLLLRPFIRGHIVNSGIHKPSGNGIVKP